MKHLIFLIVINLFITPLFGQNQEFDQKALEKIKKYQAYDLENGLRVINLNNNDSSNVFLRLYTDLPQNVNKQHRAFIEIDQELRKSDYLNLPKEWTNKKLDELKLNLKKDPFGYYLTCPIGQLDTAIFLLSKILAHPLVTANYLEETKIKYKIKNDNLKDPVKFKIDRTTKALIYGKGHPSTFLLSDKEINALKISKYEEYYYHFYRPNNTYLLLMSTITEEHAVMVSRRHFDKLKKKELPVSDYKLNKIQETKIAFFDTLATGQYELSMIFPFSMHPFTFDYEKSELLSILIQKILKKKLIDETALANEITARFQNDNISGNYRLNIKMARDSVEKVIKLTIESMNALKMGNFLLEDLQQSKKELITEFKKQGSAKKRLSWLIINSERNNLSPNYYANFVKDIDQTSKQGIQSLAGKYLSYQNSIFAVNGKWYPSLNDIIKLSKNYRIELYNINGSIRRIIPKGFNGYHILNDYINAVGGKSEISKLKDLSVRLTGKYEMNGEEFFIAGEIKHKSPDKYYQHFSLIRPKKDTLLINLQVYDGENGLDSTMQGKKRLSGNALNLLKYKSIVVPATKYREWNYKTKILRADTLNNTFVFVVEFTNPAKQKFIDFYDVDKGLRYKRIIVDAAYLSKRTILYDGYRKIEGKDVIYPFFQLITGKETVIKLVIRETDAKTRLNKKLFEID